jgi:C4-dicarboxylate-binding protein DctP
MKKLLLASVLLLIAASPAAAQTVLKFALPTPETHPRNQALAKWANTVSKQSQGQLLISLRHGVTDYSGARIPAAVAEGAYDLGAPGWWHLSRYAPDYAVASLPLLYGREIDAVRRAYDGPLGEELKNKLEEVLRVRVIGRPLDLGFGHVYSTAKPIKAYADIQKLNIRVPGGGADLARYLVFEATPRRVAVPDLADALRQEHIGGLLATHNFVADAALWKAGVRHAFLDNQVFYNYTPIINRARWESLFDDERLWITESWATTSDEMRRITADRQERSRAIAVRSGVQFTEASSEQRQTMRATLLEEQPAIAAALDIDPKIIELAKSHFEGPPR